MLSDAKRSTAVPLQTKLRIFGFGIFGVLTAALCFCIVLLVYYTDSYESLFGVNYLQSTTLSHISSLNELMLSYGEYPTEETRQQLAASFVTGETLLHTLSEEQANGSHEQRMLLQAIDRTYAYYRQHADTLFTAYTRNGAQDQPFYIRYYDALEAGNYVDSYLKQLIQQTLADSRAVYAARLRVIYIGPIILILFMLAAALFTQRFSRWVGAHLVDPVLQLAQAAQTLAAHHMDIPDLAVTGEDEIGVLTSNFNRMKADCRELLVTQQQKDELTRHLFEEHIQRLDTEKQLSVTRFDALRNQVNPHFLFNTLSLIAQTAQQEDADETELLIRQLSDLLRYNLYNTNERVPLQLELETLHSYMYIQESRFLDKLGFWVDCRVDPTAVVIPAFTLQPLVENAVSHGIRPKENGGLVRVSVRTQGSRLQIRVTDNGVGMPPETLAALRDGSYRPPKKNSGLGVGNVAARFRMLYPDSRFSVFSRPGRGTCILLEYPVEAPAAREKE